MIGFINCSWRQATVGKSVLLILMTYEPLGMHPTHDLSSLALNALVIYRTHNTMNHVETQATKVRGRHGVERVMMTPKLLDAHT